MAKAKQASAYVVTSPTPLIYNGKEAVTGDIVTDLPGESLTWLLADGLIAPSDTPAPTVDEPASDGEDK